MFEAIKPTGWTHKEGAAEKSSTSSVVSIERRSKNIIVYGSLNLFKYLHENICLFSLC